MTKKSINAEVTEFLSYTAAVSVVLTAAYFIYVHFIRKQRALKHDEWRKFKLVEKKSVTHNSRIFRFELQTPDTILGLPVGNHISLRFFSDTDNAYIERPYTPVTSDDDPGYFELLIKIYPKGKMGQYLDHLPVGTPVEVKGPHGRIHYL